MVRKVGLPWLQQFYIGSQLLLLFQIGPDMTVDDVVFVVRGTEVKSRYGNFKLAVRPNAEMSLKRLLIAGKFAVAVKPGRKVLKQVGFFS